MIVNEHIQEIRLYVHNLIKKWLDYWNPLPNSILNSNSSLKDLPQHPLLFPFFSS